MKRYFLLLVLALVLTFSFTGCSSDDSVNTDDMGTVDDGTDDGNSNDPTPLEAEVLLDVSYGSHPQQVYDLYLPAGRSSVRTRVIMLVHGGGWTEGDKEDMQQFVTFVQQEFPNHAIVNVNYVLAVFPNTPAFPNQFLDLDQAIEKLNSESEDLQILPEFGLIGTSAGAHLSLMYDYEYDTDDQVKFVCDIVGPTNFTDPFYADDPLFEAALEFFVDESQYPDGTNYAEAVSPVYQVSSSSSPTIMFYGMDDPIVPLSNGQTLNSTLSDAMIDHSFTVYQGGHGDDWSAQSQEDLRMQLIGYINLYLPELRGSF